MKALVCEMCSSHDIVKQDGMYVCQSCGTKYTPEDAKSLMTEIEGTVDVSGSTVKVDNSDSLSNLRQLAVRARLTGNTESAAKYYEMVAMQDPNDWEAAFYSVFYQSSNTNIAGIVTAANRVTNTIPSTMQMIKSSVPQEEQQAAYMNVVSSVKSLCESMHSSASAHYSKFSTVDGAKSEYNARNYAAFSMVSTAASLIENLFDDKQTALSLYQFCYNSDSGMNKANLNKAIERIDPAQAQKNEISTANSKGCSRLMVGFAMIFFGLIGAVIGAADRRDQVFLIIGVILTIIGVIVLIAGAAKKSEAARKQAEFNRTHGDGSNQ